MKRLPPSLREKERYIRFQVHSEEDVELGDLVNAVWNSALEYLGSRDASEANFWVIGNRFDEEEQEGLVRVNASMIDDFRATLTLIDRIGSEKAFLEVVDVSGTIKSIDDRS